mgnify:CR=1 FL=1|jgi:sulfate transport system ATP-binding protein
MEIELRKVHKSFGGTTALDAVDLSIHSGELIALLGPSGSGKTTLLRSIAGLESLSSGVVLFDGKDASTLSVQQRRVGFVFQHYALFRHMRVLDNVAFGLRCRPRAQRPSRAEILARARSLLDVVRLPHLADRYPDQLSGGERQRVALARAMAIEPSVLLLDEPFGALDARVRDELRRWLRELHDANGYTTVFVTHDQAEALELADRIVVLNRGRIEQSGTPEQLYDAPANRFVFDFLGRGCALSGQFTLQGFVPDGASRTFPVSSGTTPKTQGQGEAHVRPHDWRPCQAQDGLPVQVLRARRLGAKLMIEAKAAAQAQIIDVEWPHEPGLPLPEAGSTLTLEPVRLHVFD